ncbi:MAG TPA: hypothetical protein VFB41_07795 [Solirubrobacteraceae bacterium]|nr:hypothetical protein [Solirubrobacteraceae bacterium]
MSGLGYKLLGMVVFKAGKLYLRRRYGGLVPSRRAALAGLFGLLLVGVVAGATRRLGEPSAG